MVGIGHNGAPKQSVFRNAKKGKNATLILNSCLQNEKLSLAAKGLLSELLSMPQDWVFVAKNLIRSGCKKDKLYGLIDELITHGYMGREKVRDDKNQFSHFFYWVSDLPFPEYPEMGLHAPHAEKPEEENNSTKTTASGKTGNGATSGSTASGKTESGIKKNKLNKDTNKKTSKKDFASDCEVEKPKYKRWSKSEVDQVFSEFWNVCPRKIGKVTARDKFEELIKSKKGKAPKSDPKTLTACMLSYAQKNKTREERFVLHPTTWLNQDRWVDELETMPATKGWGWWRSDDRWGLLTPDDWRNMIRAHKPNGVWPWQELGPPPGHPECLLPELAQDAYGDKYSDQVEELKAAHGESE